jgi:hypothetical protein
MVGATPKYTASTRSHEPPPTMVTRGVVAGLGVDATV